MLLVAVYIHIMNFYLMFTLRWRQADFVASVLSLTLAINNRWCRCCRRKSNHWCHGIDENPEQGLITGINNTGDNLLPVTTTPAGVIDTA
jgi:hypothetical protein